MAETFEGNWRVRVTGTSAKFSQRFRIAGASTGNGLYSGVVGTEVTVRGASWSIRLEWNNNRGSGWRQSLVQRTQSFQSPLVLAVVLKADDGFPNQRDNDFNDLVLLCEDPDPVFDVVGQPFAVDRTTLAMLPGGVFEARRGVHYMGVRIRNTWDLDWSEALGVMIGIGPSGRAALEAQQVRVLDAWSAQEQKALQQEVADGFVRVPVLRRNEERTIYLKLDLGEAAAGRPEIAFVAQRSIPDPTFDQPTRQVRRQIQVSRPDGNRPVKSLERTMEPLFRLTLLRPAVAQDPASPSIATTQDTEFQEALANAASAEQPREALRQVAQSFVAGDGFIGSPESTQLSAELATLAPLLDALELKAMLSHAEVVDAVKEAFGSDPEELIEGEGFADAVARLRDSLLAIKQLQEEHGRPIEAIANQLRDLELIRKLAADESFPANGAALRRYRRRSLRLPTAANLRSILSTAKLDEDRRKILAEAQADRRQRAEALFDKYLHLHRSIDELTSLGGEHFQATPQEPHEGFTPPAALDPTTLLTRQTAYIERLSDLNVKQLEAALERGGEVDPLREQDTAGASSAAVLAEKVLTASPRLPSGSPTFRPLTLGEAGFRLHEGTLEVLSEGTVQLLAERQITIAEQPLDRIVSTLQSESDTTGQDLEILFDQPVQRSVKRIGDTLVTTVTPLPSAWASLVIGPDLFPLLPALPPDPRIPHTRGKVAPAGVADLLIVNQQLTGYEAADVAHIENVLKGERKQREHSRRRETEELTFRETEITTSEERELESTNRFEMTRETSTTIKEDASLKAGLTVSGKYGPTVEFSASAEGSVSRSKEEATKAAASFSQDVTQRSANKISERVLERASLRVTNEVIEKNSHELNNVGGTGHISGVYQWVSKVYQAQMFNYGLRTMFDFMVPEPAAFLMEVLKSAHASTIELQKPPAFTLEPSQISEGRYGYWVRTYGATDVAPPPEIYKTRSLDFKAGGGDDKTNYNHSGQIAIDDGYMAVNASVGVVLNTWKGKQYSVDVVLGRKAHRFIDNGAWIWTTPLDYERDSIPFALDSFNVSQVAVAVEVKCQRTERAMEKWRLDTHAKLTTAYKARLSEYEEKLAALQLQAGVAIQGKNPALNVEIMKDELKKNCISILTDQHYDLFDAVNTSWSNGLPEIDVFEAEGEGAYVRFFEQAFEWEQMTWLTYPYFWGRKSQWDERLAFEDPDPLFNQFLKAGYCRVAVPARLGFEGAIDHFMTYGELWNGGPLPPISSPLYLPIADEIAERLDQPGDEVPQGDPWIVRIPTTLVHLRADDKLPKWQQDADGNWMEA